MRQRNFGEDFVRPAIRGLNKKAMQRVSVALDAAIAFGALEHAAENQSLQNTIALEEEYWKKVNRLQAMP